MLGVRVATDEVRFGDAAQEDPAAGIDQAPEDVRVDADSRPDELLHRREVAFAVEDLVSVELGRSLGLLHLCRSGPQRRGSQMSATDLAGRKRP